MKTISSFHQAHESTGIYIRSRPCLRVLLPIRPSLHYSFLPNLLTQLSSFLLCHIISLYWIISICLKTRIDMMLFFALTYTPPQILFIFSASPTVNPLKRPVNIRFPLSYFPLATLFI